MVERQYHEAWHILFANMTPLEIVICIINSWAPKGYFQKVHIEAEWENVIFEYDLNGPISDQAKTIIAVFEDNYKKYPHLWLKLFQNRSFVSIIEEIVNVWSPPDCFKIVEIEGRSENENFKFSYTAV